MTDKDEVYFKLLFCLLKKKCETKRKLVTTS